MTAAAAFSAKLCAQICRMLARQTKLSANLIQSLNLFLRKLFRAAELTSLVQKLCIKFQRLHLVICSQKIHAVGQRTVIFKQHCVIVRKVLLYRVRNLIRRRCSILCNRHTAQCNNRLRHNRSCQRNARNRKRRCKSRMRVNNRTRHPVCACTLSYAS